MATTEDIISTHKTQMGNGIENLRREFASVRTGRASAVSVERIKVDYYGVSTPIIQLASIKSPDAHLLVIEPWDKSIVKDVEKAILASDLGITPANDGSSIRLPFPPLTEERRKELVKQCRQLAEEAKVAVRNIRRDANSKLERLVKNESLSQDEEYWAEDQMQKLTDQHIQEINEVLRHKEAEVMEV